MSVNHYKWLEHNFPIFLENLGHGDLWEWNKGIVGAHGDKAYGYRYTWDDENIPFPHGVAIFFLSYLSPWADETRETKDGWINVKDWVVDNYDRFKKFLPDIDEDDERWKDL